MSHSSGYRQLNGTFIRAGCALLAGASGHKRQIARPAACSSSLPSRDVDQSRYIGGRIFHATETGHRSGRNRPSRARPRSRGTRYPPQARVSGRAVSRDARYTRYTGDGHMLRSHSTAMIPPALRGLAARQGLARLASRWWPPRLPSAHGHQPVLRDLRQLQCPGPGTAGLPVRRQ